MTPDARRKIFNRAADLVEQGWCQKHVLVEENGVKRRCIVGAICDAVDEVKPCDQMRSDIVKRVCGHLELRPSVVILGHWNDAPERTQAEVAAVLRAVA